MDIKPIRNNRASDGACRSSDTLRYMTEWCMMSDPAFLYLKLRVILNFKLLCHHLHVTQHHWKARGGNFKAVTLCFCAVLMLDGFRADGKHVDHFVLALCHMLLTFDWRRSKVVVSAAGHISVADKGKDLKAVVCIMLDDGTVNSTRNVTAAHLENSQNAIREALPKLELVISEALENGLQT